MISRSCASASWTTITWKDPTTLLVTVPLFGPANLLERPCIRHSVCPAQASDSELPCNWHNSKLSMQLFDRNLFLFLAHCHYFSSSLQGAVSPAYSGMLPVGRAHSLESLHFCLAKAHKLDSSASCVVALKTLHLNLKSTLVFQHWPSMVPRVPGCGDSCFPLCGEGHIPGQAAHQVSNLRPLSLPPESPVALFAPDPFVVTLIHLLAPRRHSPPPSCSVQCPLVPSPCRSARSPALPPLRSSRLHLRFESPPAEAEARCSRVAVRIFFLARLFSQDCVGIVHAHASPVVSFAVSVLVELVPLLLQVTCFFRLRHLPALRVRPYAWRSLSGFVHAHACPWVFFAFHVHRVPHLLWLFCLLRFFRPLRLRGWAPRV